MKEKIILLAHGSSDPDWSNSFVALTQAACTKNRHVALGFMELSEPSLESCVKQAKNDGYECVSVLPLFLAKGRHLKSDIPSMLKDYEARFDIKSTLHPPIGEHPLLAQTLCHIIDEAI